jgi:threonine synthase
LADGTIDKGASVVCILTGHVLKDPDATVRYHTGTEAGAASDSPAARAGRLSNKPIPVANDLDAICQLIEAEI